MPRFYMKQITTEQNRGDISGLVPQAVIHMADGFEDAQKVAHCIWVRNQYLTGKRRVDRSHLKLTKC